MRECKNNEKFWQEWDVFCKTLIERTRDGDNHALSQGFQNDDPPSPGDLSIFLDAHLRIMFSPSSADIPPIAIDAYPSLLEPVLLERIADAEVLLTRLLEKEELQNIQSEADLVKASRL
ncbi:MAG: hypothetical protein LBG91_02390, partial [Treponema sp.]|nr:hypothetical protein [Treponema sp.]